jgi:WD40 repeat protein
LFPERRLAMNERTVFLTALEKEDSAQRKEYLDQVCAGDPALRDRVEALLRSHEREGKFLDVPAVEQLVPGKATTEEIPGAADDGHTLKFLTPSNKLGSLGCLGHYEIQEVIGRGGMGMVLKAFDERLHRVVAIKVMAGELATSATARRRFVREAQAAAAVRNDHVIDIHAVEEANGLPYLAMEYIAGISLQERLDSSGPLEVKEILRIGMQIAAGLAAAHAQGLIHRDVKPSNILLENGVERVKITDLGLARAVDDASLTQSGTVAGTPMYMAPEQARGEAVDPRADLFSLGSVLYALCTGRVPFRASSTMAVLKRVCEDAPRPIREINPEIPDWLVGIIARLHAKDPADRVQSAAEVAELLSAHLAPLQQTAAVRMRRGPRSPSRRDHRWRVVAAALTLLLASLGLTEATGVTRIAATVLRIRTPDGTLVVEVEDPNVKVTIEGDGGLVITGAGPQEVRLRPGSYRVRAAKDGKPIQTDVVAITRGDRHVVSIHLEPAAVGEIRRFEGHIGNIRGMAVSADGSRAVTGSWDKTVRVWDLTRGKELHCFSALSGIDDAIVCVALSPDGRLAMAGSRRGTVWLWEVDTGAERERCTVPVVDWDGGATSLAFSPDGRHVLIGGADGIVRLWQVSPWKEVKRLDHGQRRKHGKVWSVCFAPEGRQALTAGGPDSDGGIRLWDLQTGTELRAFKGHEQGLWCAVFSPSGHYILSASNDATVRLWDAGTGKELRRFRGHTRGVTCVAFSPDGRQALSAGQDHTVRLWDVETGEERHRFMDQDGEVSALAYMPRGRQALSGSFQGRVRLWQLPP